LEGQIKELQAELTDMMFFIETRKKIENQTDLQNGSILLVPGSNTEGNAARLSTKKKKTKSKS